MYDAPHQDQDDDQDDNENHSLQPAGPIAGGQELYKYDSHSHKVWAVAWSPDGTRIASGGLDGVVHVWQVPSTE